MEIKKGGRRQGGVWVQMKATGKRFQTSRVKGLAAIISGVLEKGMLKDGDCVRTGKESEAPGKTLCVLEPGKPASDAVCHACSQVLIPGDPFLYILPPFLASSFPKTLVSTIYPSS